MIKLARLFFFFPFSGVHKIRMHVVADSILDSMKYGHMLQFSYTCNFYLMLCHIQRDRQETTSFPEAMHSYQGSGAHWEPEDGLLICLLSAWGHLSVQQSQPQRGIQPVFLPLPSFHYPPSFLPLCSLLKTLVPFGCPCVGSKSLNLAPLTPPWRRAPVFQTFQNRASLKAPRCSLAHMDRISQHECNMHCRWGEGEDGRNELGRRENPARCYLLQPHNMPDNRGLRNIHFTEGKMGSKW